MQTAHLALACDFRDYCVVATDVQDLRKHVSTMHPACPQCANRFMSSNRLRFHQKKILHCFCVEYDVASDGRNGFGTHVSSSSHDLDGENYRKWTARENRKVAGKEAPTDCTTCRRTFADAEVYGKHMKEDRHRIPCPLFEVCGRRFKTRATLVAHVESCGCCAGLERPEHMKTLRLFDCGHRITKSDIADLRTGVRIGMVGDEETEMPLKPGLSRVALTRDMARAYATVPMEQFFRHRRHALKTVVAGREPRGDESEDGDEDDGGVALPTVEGSCTPSGTC